MTRNVTESYYNKIILKNEATLFEAFKLTYLPH